MDTMFNFMREMRKDMDSLNRALVTHMEHEERAMDALYKRLEEGDAIMSKMASQLEMLSHIQIAFPVDERGQPNFIGHRIRHEKDETEAKDNHDIILEGKKKAAGVMVEWALRIMSFGFLAWLALHHSGADKVAGQ